MSLDDLPQEAFEEFTDVTAEFIESMSEIALEYEVEDELAPLIWASWQMQISHSVTRDEDIPKFVNQFVQITDSAYQAGELEAKSRFNSLEEAREAYEAQKDE